MIYFTTLFALVVGGTGVTQPAAAGMVGLMARIDLGHLSVGTFQRRQTTGIPQIPSQCTSICDPINNILTSDNCPPSECCLATFETSYFNCFMCVGSAANVTDYTQPQLLIDKLYDQCASLGASLPVLTFPGQNATRALSSVVLPSSTTVTHVITSVAGPTFVQTTFNPSTSPATTTASTTNSPTPSLPSLNSGIRSVETNCFNFIASVMMLGIWFHFA